MSKWYQSSLLQPLSSVIEEIKTTGAESTSNLTQKITTESDRAKVEEGSIKTSLEELKNNTNKEVSDLKLNDSEIQAAVLAETNRATASEAELESKVNKKADIDSPLFTGIPRVAESPDTEDSSQRIPSTNWVRNRIIQEVNAAILDIYYTKIEINQLLNSKADLVNGIVPLKQLPVTYWIDVE